jgi:MFS family permease
MSVSRALERPAFRGLLVGQVVSIVGDRLNYLALIALLTAHAVAHGEDRATLLAALAWAMLGPSLLVSPWAGALVDRWPLVRTLLVTDVLRAVVVATIPLVYLATGALLPVLALVALAFTLTAVFLPARSALPPHLVPPTALAAGNAVLVLGGVVATMIGTGLGGPLVDRFGPATALYLDALTYGVSVLALATILRSGGEVRPPAEATPGTPGLGAVLARAARDTREGWGIALATPAARVPLVAAVATWIVGGVLHVAGTSHIQRGGAAVTGLGLLLAALAIGAVLGTTWALRREGRRGAAAAASDARGDRRGMLGVGLLGAGAGLFGFAAAGSLATMAAAGFVVGVFAAPVLFLAETALQEAVPAGARGRVFAARDVLARGAFLLTAAAAAPLVHWRGDAFALAAGAAFLVGLGGLALAGAARDATR